VTGVSTLPPAARRAFDRGLEALDRDDPQAAVDDLGEAFQAATGDPQVMSAYGLALALAGSDRLRGVALCETAIRRLRDASPADLHLRLARAYLSVHYRAQAVQALRAGAQVDPDHPGIHDAFVVLGIRRAPVLPFLRRSHPLNKYLGLLRHRLFSQTTEVK
jgi:hypothetical protein